MPNICIDFVYTCHSVLYKCLNINHISGSKQVDLHDAWLCSTWIFSRFMKETFCYMCYLNNTGQAKISHFTLQVTSHQDVSGSQISVDNVPVLQVGHSFCNLTSHVDQMSWAQNLSLWGCSTKGEKEREIKMNHWIYIHCVKRLYTEYNTHQGS